MKLKSLVFLTVVFGFICSPSVFAVNSNSTSVAVPCLIRLQIEDYCYIRFTDPSLEAIKVDVSNGQSQGHTHTDIQFGANFNFKVKATLGWNNGFAPGQWRVTLNENLDASGWLWYGGWDDIGTTITQYRIGRRTYYVYTYDNTWDIYPYGLLTHVSPGRYDTGQVVTIQVRGIDLDIPADTYTGGWLRLDLIKWI